MATNSEIHAYVQAKFLKPVILFLHGSSAL